MNYENNVAFIDSANFWHACSRKGLNFNVDFVKLRDRLRKFGNIRINYYTAVKEDENGVQNLRRLFDFLQYHGYNVVEKRAKITSQDADGKDIYKGNMDIEITLDCVKLMHNTNIRTVFLFTGDGDFVPLVRYMQDYGAKVIVVSTRETPNSFVADELRRVADDFIDILELKPHIEMERKENVHTENSNSQKEEREEVKEAPVE